MPEKKTVARARRAKKQGKAPKAQAGEFVREEMHHIREGKHGAKDDKQAVAIGLSKARRAGVAIPSKGRRGAAKKRSATGGKTRTTAKKRSSRPSR